MLMNTGNAAVHHNPFVFQAAGGEFFPIGHHEETFWPFSSFENHYKARMLNENRLK